MASKKGQVTLAGRFPKGTRVELVEVADESVLRSEGGRVVGSARVGEDGTVRFTDGVTAGNRYFIRGLINGRPEEVRARGNTADEESAVLSQPPVQPSPMRYPDGKLQDEAPDQRELPAREAPPVPAMEQVGDVPLRSYTLRGEAHPVEPGEPSPYPAQSDDWGPQRSDTPEGMATPIDQGTFARQDQVPEGTWQRSDTPEGIATPIPRGSAVRSQLEKESPETKAMKGEPVKAAASPVSEAHGAPKE
jgi:hypothetical protein